MPLDARRGHAVKKRRPPAGSFYVGDAAGRPRDHGDDDAKFARVNGLGFHTQTEFFERLHVDVVERRGGASESFSDFD